VKVSHPNLKELRIYQQFSFHKMSGLPAFQVQRLAYALQRLKAFLTNDVFDKNDRGVLTKDMILEEISIRFIKI